MLWPDQHNLSIWLLLESVVLFLFLGHDACPFVFPSLVLAAWAIATTLELSFCFALDYTGLSSTRART